MAAYKRLLIQQQQYNGGAYKNVGSAIDTYEKFKVACQESPFSYLPEAKELAKRDWPDEHGEDVYVPADGVKFKAYSMEVKFLYVGKEDAMASDLSGFIDYMYGRNSGGQVMLAIYDEYTRTGRRGIYLESVDDELYYHSDTDTDAIAVFRAKFRVTDPVTRLDINFNVA